MRILLVGVILIATVALGVAAYMGAFHRVAITEQDRGPYTLVYREISASEMSKVGEITTALDSLLEGAGIVRRKPLDVFFPEGREEVGFAVESATADQLAILKDKAKVTEIPAQRFMVAEFPWRNRASYLVGYIKVDPALAKYRSAHLYKKVEALALHDGRAIVYMQPVVASQP